MKEDRRYMRAKPKDWHEALWMIRQLRKEVLKLREDVRVERCVVKDMQVSLNYANRDYFELRDVFQDQQQELLESERQRKHLAARLSRLQKANYGG